MIRVKDFPDWKVGVHKQGVSSGSVGKFNSVGMLSIRVLCFFLESFSGLVKFVSFKFFWYVQSSRIFFKLFLSAADFFSLKKIFMEYQLFGSESTLFSHLLNILRYIQNATVLGIFQTFCIFC